VSHGFLPRTDGALLAWSLSFSQKISQSPELFGLTPQQSQAYEQLHLAFAQALELCAPSIRNKVAVVRKNDARSALRTNAKLLSLLIHGQPDVTDAQKISLGLNVRKAPTATPPPASAPGLDVVAVRFNTVTVRLYQAGTDTGLRGRPRGTSGAMIFRFTGEEPPTDAGDWRFHALCSATITDITFDPDTVPGSRVWFSACWFNSRKQIGPMSAPIGTTLQGGGVELASAMRRAA
jgi:hypothetical protein